jgi:hypothetical protein
VREAYTTEHEPDGVLLKACGNRRASVCPACAETYRRDAWHLIAAGLRGGKVCPRRSPKYRRAAEQAQTLSTHYGGRVCRPRTAAAGDRPQGRLEFVE